MKKTTSFLLLFLLAISCSEPENDFTLPVSDASNASRPKPVDPRSDPTKLSKVVFFPGQTYEKRFYFYPNRLLKRVANRFGVTYETYLYDSNNNLVHIIRSNPATFTYDTNNYATSCNGKAVVYDSSANKYVYFYDPPPPLNDPECPECFDYPLRTEVTLTPELLLTSNHTYYTSSDGDYMIHGMVAGYSNNNMRYIFNWTDPSGPYYSHDNKVNPLKAAFLPVCRALSVAGDSTYLDAVFCSANNVIANDYEETDQSEVYEITYNANNLPVSSVLKSYYFGNLESTRVYAQYYYQTDTLP